MNAHSRAIHIPPSHMEQVEHEQKKPRTEGASSHLDELFDELFDDSDAPAALVPRQPAQPGSEGAPAQAGT
eukprot:836753-Prymnesium_polylepis.1